MPPRHLKVSTEPGPWIRDQVVKAMMDAWADGSRFTVTLDEKGDVHVKKGNTLIVRYDDAGQAIRNLFPDKAGIT